MLIPIVLAAATWGREWTAKTVLARCDNAAVVAVINKGSSKEEDVMQLLCCLTFIQAKHRFNIKSAHIKGKDNDWADALLPPTGKETGNATIPATPRPDDHMEARLELAALDRVVERYFRAGLAPATHRTYHSAILRKF